MEQQYYLLEITYPDGHIEVIEEEFKKGLDAIEYGKNMLAQIAQTEQFHAGEDKTDAYFTIIAVKGRKRKIAFDSRF